MRRRISVLTVFPVLIAGAILFSMLPTGAWAGHVMAGALSLQDAWSRPSLGKAPNGVVYLKISNKGGSPDRLIGASAGVSKSVMIHETAMEGGVMKMRHAMNGIVVPAKGSVELKPGGFHVMLMGLTKKLIPGEGFELTLTFERQGEVRIPVEIKPLGYKGSTKAMGKMGTHSH